MIKCTIYILLSVHTSCMCNETGGRFTQKVPDKDKPCAENFAQGESQLHPTNRACLALAPSKMTEH